MTPKFTPGETVTVTVTGVVRTCRDGVLTLAVEDPQEPVMRVPLVAVSADESVEAYHVAVQAAGAERRRLVGAAHQRSARRRVPAGGAS